MKEPRRHQLVTLSRTWCGRGYSSLFRVELVEPFTEPTCLSCLKAIKADKFTALEARRRFLVARE